jgi:hypothetical protein
MSTLYSVDGLNADLLILAMIRARYDYGAMPPGVYALVRKLETEISWRKHFRPIGEAPTKVVNRVRPAVAPSPQAAVGQQGVTNRAR